MKLTLMSRTIIDGVQVEYGEQVEVRDWRLVDSLLRSGCAIPSDTLEHDQWRALQPKQRSWVTGWRPPK